MTGVTTPFRHRRRRRPVLGAGAAFAIAALTAAPAALGAGIDPRAYTCGALHAVIAANRFVFISQPAFGDFVVAGPAFCGGSEVMDLRSVPTADNPACPVNYCVSRYNFAPN